MIPTFRSRLIACHTILIPLLLFSAKLGAAQTPETEFENLSSILEEGDSVRVTTAAGVRIDGDVERIAFDNLVLNGNSGHREVPGATILAVDRRRPDVWWDGMLIGAVAGAGLGAIADASDSGGIGPDLSPFYIPAFSLLGAGVGSVIDLFIRQYDAVFAVSGTALTVTPITSTRLKGLRVAYSF